MQMGNGISEVLHGRSWSLIARNIFSARNYLSLIRMMYVVRRPFSGMARYLFGSGTYPAVVTIRTPIGPQNVKLFSSHDALTLNEIFCRHDYRTGKPPQFVLDIGSNIGMSALYFLTRSATSYCELYEPNPKNLPRLKENLREFESRFTLHDLAVGIDQGVAQFATEATGRYGTLDPKSWVYRHGSEMLSEGSEVIPVQVESINCIIESALARHDVIDLLKIDTEGTELEITQAINSEFRSRVRRIVIEWPSKDFTLPGFRARSAGGTVTLTNMSFK